MGVTPQFRLSDRYVITADFSSLNNVRQHLNWDGSVADRTTNLMGTMYTTTLGLTYYFGKHKQHADWYLKKIAIAINKLN